MSSGKTAIPLFHDGMKKLQRWKHSSIESNSSCLRRRRETDTCVARDFSLTQTDLQLEAVDRSGAQIIVKTVRLSVGPKSTLEGVRLLLDFFRLDSLLRRLR